VLRIASTYIGDLDMGRLVSVLRVEGFRLKV
jgi:hypothetical protein